MKQLIKLALTLTASVWIAHAADKTWDSIRAIPEGHAIRVHTDGQKQTGAFIAVDESTVRFKTAAGAEVTVPRSEVTKVYSQSRSHRGRNFLIGTAVGVAVGAVFYGTFGRMLENEGAEAGGVLFVPIAIGAAVGAALPTGSMKLVYEPTKR